ncbi:DivIVA domain-containing protein [Pseudokineococcus basanitobsidens]|uniref:Cell wall synthesis protein Wag31 n=1 Tax=Pseudokineococcus basanitobsidens TaxID=1926649 RepID=A0ABU8RHH0_9ACTN
MALTPESVASRKFPVTRFRDGYDQSEVDDFLDEVVSELRRLTGENDDLREQLAAAERRAGDGATATPGADDGAAPSDAAPVTAAATPAAAEPVEPAGPGASSDQTRAASVPAQAGPVDDEGAAAPVSAGSAAGVLALAQRLHDEHVRAGEEERDRLVGDARTEAERLVSQAQETERTTLASLEERRTDELGALERERGLLERKIDELRGFEREYRSRLRAYLEGQLKDLDGTAAVVPGADAASATGGRS